MDSPTELLQGILDAPEGLVIFALDRGYRYLAFNENHRRTMAAIWNVEIAVGTSMLDAIGRPDDRTKARANFDRALSGERFVLIEAYGDADAGQRRHYRDAYAPLLDGSGAVVGLTVFLTDVTEQQRIEEELERHRQGLEELAAQRTAEMLHAQKLESLGVLAGGIAHDFNNILAAILGAAELAELQLDRDDVVLRELKRIQRSAKRGSELTNQMLSYAGRAERHPEVVELPALIEDMFELLHTSVSRTAHVRRQLARGTPPIMADAAQIRQVVMNLITNASDAVGDGGQIVVRSRPDHREGRLYALLEVADNGPGMDAETQSRIFDPFFSTKFQGRGLGLAAVQGIIASHAGHLEVETRPGQGSTFRVWLPSLSEVPDGRVSGHRAPGPPPLAAHVLVVDDEDEVLEICEAFLTLAGATVSLAQDGDAAIAYARDDASIDVVLLDLTMPGPGPEETLAQLEAVRPGLPVVLFSGYDEHEVRRRFGDRVLAFLPKPFTGSGLVDVLRRALETGPG